MKGTIYVADKELGYKAVERDLPTPGTGALLTKIRLANVCGSDLHNWKTCAFPDGMGGGHEFVCEIVEIGEGVETDAAGQPIKVGDRIVAPYYLTCMECDQCEIGNFQGCRNAYRYMPLSADVWPYFGCAFATHYYIRPKQLFYKVPEEIPDAFVAGVNCAFSQVYGGIQKQLDVRKGDTVLVQGAGGLGLYATAICSHIGAKVVVIDAVKERLQLAKEFGADYVIDINEAPTVDERVKLTLEYTNGLGMDKAIEVAGPAPAFQEGLMHLGFGGSYAIMGINTLDRKAEIHPGYITRKLLTVYGVLRYDPVYIHRSLDFIKETMDKYPYHKLCDEPLDMKDINEIMVKVDKREIARAVLKP